MKITPPDFAYLMDALIGQHYERAERQQARTEAERARLIAQRDDLARELVKRSSELAALRGRSGPVTYDLVRRLDLWRECATNLAQSIRGAHDGIVAINAFDELRREDLLAATAEAAQANGPDVGDVTSGVDADYSGDPTGWVQRHIDEVREAVKGTEWEERPRTYRHPFRMTVNEGDTFTMGAGEVVDIDDPCPGPDGVCDCQDEPDDDVVDMQVIQPDDDHPDFEEITDTDPPVPPLEDPGRWTFSGRTADGHPVWRRICLGANEQMIGDLSGPKPGEHAWADDWADVFAGTTLMQYRDCTAEGCGRRQYRDHVHNWAPFSAASGGETARRCQTDGCTWAQWVYFGHGTLPVTETYDVDVHDHRWDSAQLNTERGLIRFCRMPFCTAETDAATTEETRHV